MRRDEGTSPHPTPRLPSHPLGSGRGGGSSCRRFLDNPLPRRANLMERTGTGGGGWGERVQPRGLGPTGGHCGVGNESWVRLGPGAWAKRIAGSCCWGRQWGPEPAPPVPSLGLEGNSLPVSRVPRACQARLGRRDRSVEGAAKEGQPPGGPGWDGSGGNTCQGPSPPWAGRQGSNLHCSLLDLPPGEWQAAEGTVFYDPYNSSRK